MFKYNGFIFYRNKIDEINEKYYKDYPEFKLKFIPHITWTKEKTYVHKIGIRITNSFCNKSKSERKLLLKSYEFDLEYDVKSSVPRLTLSLNNLKFYNELDDSGNEIDFYKLINDYLKDSNKYIFDSNRKEAIKKLHMRAYFNGDSYDSMCGHIWNKIDHKGLSKNDVYECIVDYRQALEKAEGGKTYGSEIFYVESVVYLMTLYDLLSSNKLVWLVYDAFYTKNVYGLKKREFDDMIRNGLAQSFDDYIKHGRYSLFNDNDTLLIKYLIIKMNILNYNLCFFSKEHSSKDSEYFLKFSAKQD